VAIPGTLIVVLPLRRRTVPDKPAWRMSRAASLAGASPPRASIRSSASATRAA
jgi:hypothetical protein